MGQHLTGGEGQGRRADEEAFPRPVTFYAATKQAVENIGLNYARWHGVDFGAVRYGAVAGPWSGRGGGWPSQAFREAVTRAVQGEEAEVPAIDMEWVYSKDAATGTVLALFAPDLTRDAIEAFLIDEAHLLDLRQFETWMELFTEDGLYWAPSSPTQESPLDHVSLIYDDRDAMTTRIRRLRHPRIHAQNPPTRTSRIVANPIVLEADADGRFIVRSKFMLYEYRPSVPEAQERILGGTYWHTLVPTPDGLRIKFKKALLANCDARLSPFFVYF